MNKMKLSQFSFDLPEELIAEYPTENRDESRLMVVHKDTGKVEHKLFKDIIDSVRYKLIYSRSWSLRKC